MFAQSMHAVPSPLAILAPGLLGASLAKTVSERYPETDLRLWARRPEVRLDLARFSWAGTVCATLEKTVRDAALVVICTPVDVVVSLVEMIRPLLREGALVTDVGSVKSEICRLSTPLLAPTSFFVGSHPMAGSEKSGHAHAQGNLFEGRPCLVTPFSGTDETAHARVCAFWEACGAKVHSLSPETHDEIVAHVSHLPHLLASSLASFLCGKDASWRSLAGQGLRDTTRVAASDADLWLSILKQNQPEVLRALSQYQDELQKCHAFLANGQDAELRELLARGRNFRDALASWD